MKAARLTTTRPVEENPLSLLDVDKPVAGDHEVLLRVHVCGLCHTDLHIVEGELNLPKLPLIPGHQIVGTVESVGRAAQRFKPGERLGVPWLNSTCGECEFCTSDRENLCDRARFTGYHVNGGYAEYVVVPEDFVYAIPERFADTDAAPLLCAGVIGYRALRLSGIKAGQTMGLYGFGASAHIAIQILRHWGCEVYVFTRSSEHRKLAEELGAGWVGTAEQTAPSSLDAAVIFAPAGQLVPLAMKASKKGGTVALAGIYMSPIPEMKYTLLYEERTLRSIANSTREDVQGLLDVAAQIPIRTEVETFTLDDINEGLRKLKHSKIRGSGVVVLQ